MGREVTMDQPGTRNGHAMAAAPFDTARLDRLMGAAGLDLLIATSQPVVRYLLGGYRAGFFAHADAIGQSRYLPVYLYPAGAPERARYIGHRLESWQLEAEPPPVKHAEASANGSADAMRRAIGGYAHRPPAPACIGVEMPFLPADAHAVLRDAFPSARIVDAVPLLERLRAVKIPTEIDQLRHASEQVIDAMLAVFAQGADSTKRSLVEALRREQVGRGLDFDYCLITAGSSHNRAATDQRWNGGDILSLDSGGNYQGYIGDVCRMGILGEPDAELEELLAEVDTVQHAAFRAIRAGALGRAVYDGAEQALRAAPNRSRIEFLAHGMGLVTHEVPHLANRGNYAAEDADRPLEAGMVLSIETTLKHRRGYIKLEDTVVVELDGYTMLGEAGRGWNRGGAG
jgi:Xaa-Pro aminopeptidase